MSDHERERERRRSGRPALGEGPSTPVCVRMPPATYDAVHARAGAERLGVPALVRAAVAQYLASPGGERDDD
jgi:hypothetical protein